jgi:hypothetical protein
MKTGTKSIARLGPRFVPQRGITVEDSAERFDAELPDLKASPGHSPQRLDSLAFPRIVQW